MDWVQPPQELNQEDWSLLNRSDKMVEENEFVRRRTKGDSDGFQDNGL